MLSSSAFSEDLVLRHSFAGNISFALAGNTLRDAQDTCDPINGGESSSSINIPNGATIKAAYLYWSGSGSIDSTIRFNGSTITSDKNHTVSFQGRNYFSAKKDVTKLVNIDSASHSVSGVSFNGSDAYCGVNIANNASASQLSITLFSDDSTSDTVNISATVTGVLFDNILSNNTRSKTYSVVSANLTSSTKSVIDLNGGNIRAGDKIRYTIDLVETNGVAKSGISVVDHLPNNISSFEIISIPNGANNNSQQAPSGDNLTGLISISDISVAANSTESIIFDATILASSTTNTAIKNTASISAKSMPEIIVSSPTIYISKPANPATGNKPLYLHQTSHLSRVQPTSTAFHSLTDLAEKTYIITPAFQQEFIFSDSSASAYLFLQNDYSSGSWGHTLTVSLLRNNISIGSIRQTVSVPSAGSSGDNVALFEFAIPLSNSLTLCCFKRV